MNIELPTAENPVVVIHGDCLDVLPHLPKGCVDAVVTDPPYGVGLSSKSNGFRGVNGDGRSDTEPASKLYGDDESEILPVVIEAVSQCRGLCESMMVFTGNRLLHDYPKPDSIGCVFVANGSGRDRWGFGCFNPVAYYGRDPYLREGKGSRPNSARFTQPGESGIDHPCPKPIEWMRWAVRRMTVYADDIILDPFAGSGTTGVAAILEGRRAILIEKDAKYVDICRRRIAEAMCRPVTLSDGRKVGQNLFAEVAV